MAENYLEGHSNFIAAWAARDNGYGDNYGKDRCDSGPVLRPPDPKLPAFQRMVNYLTRRGIPVTVWDGEKPVPLEDWRKEAFPVEEKRDEKKICLHCGRKHIVPGTPEDEYQQMDICRDREWIDYITEQQMILDNWL